jgi:hypothetical protein
MTALRIEMRRSLALWFMPALVLVGVIAAWRALWPGVDIWRNASQSVVASVELLGPAMAGVAAWCAGRDRRRGTDYLDDLAARPAGTAVLVHLAAIIVCSVIAYAVVLIAVFARTLPGARWGGPMWLWIFAGCLGLVVQAVAGFIIGRWLPFRFVPPLVAIACYVGQIYLINGGGATTFLAAINLQQQDVLFDTNQTLLAAQALWYAGLAAVIILLWLAASRRLRRPAGLAALAAATVAAGAGGSLVLSQHGHFIVGPTAFTYDCGGTSPQVCLQPAFGAGIGELDTTIKPVAARLAGTPWAIHRIEQRDRGIGSTPSPGAVPLFLDDFRAGWALEDTVEMLGIVMYGPDGLNPCIWNDAKAEDPKDPGQFNDLVAAWIVNDAGLFQAGNSAGTKAAHWFLALTEAQRKQWLSAHVQSIRSCSLTAADFTG